MLRRELPTDEVAEETVRRRGHIGCGRREPLAATSATATVFDWSLTGTLPSLGGVPFPGSGTITATLTSSPGVYDIDTITGTVNGSAITGTSTFQGAGNLLLTNGFAFVSTRGSGKAKGTCASNKI